MTDVRRTVPHHNRLTNVAGRRESANDPIERAAMSIKHGCGCGGDDDDDDDEENPLLFGRWEVR
jgi:hypothetical protein